MAIIGLEDPLAIGLVDALEDAGIPTVGPRVAAAQLETSKSFTRALMERHGIAAQTGYRYFTSSEKVAAFLRSSEENYALKPDGLTAGQGVRIMGEHFSSRDEAIGYACNVIDERIGGVPGIVVEELLTGHEFTLQCFVDGQILTTRSRSVGLLGIADTVPKARANVQAALGAVTGPFHVRTDIGLEADAFSEEQALAAGAQAS